MSEKKKKNINLKLPGVFLLLVFGLIILSIIFKTLLIIKESKFDGSNRFTVGYTALDYSKIESFSPKDKSISVIIVKGKLGNKNLSSFLKIPVDLGVTTQEENDLSINSDLLNSIFSFGSSKLNIIDAFKLFVFSKFQNPKIYQKNLTTKSSEDDIQAAVYNIFTDPKIIDENKSIEIINSTATYGLGSRLAELITNMGGNVVLVSTSREQSKYSKIIYYKSKSYTVSKLGELLGMPLEETNVKSVSDVIIIIGEDELNKSIF